MSPSEIHERATQTAAGGNWTEVLSALLHLGLTSFGGPLDGSSQSRQAMRFA